MSTERSFIHYINQNFCDPFMPDGFVNAKMGPDGETVMLRIGCRTVELRFTLNNVELVGSDSAMGDAVEIVEVINTREEFRNESKVH